MTSCADFGVTILTAEGELVADDIVGSIECITLVCTNALRRKERRKKQKIISFKLV